MENFIVSARKYRPPTFNMVVGQKSITDTLKNAIRHNTLAQAFLFTGPRGVGKTTCARILAKTINCQNPTDNLDPCNECPSCKSFSDSASFNIYELDAASNNSVEDIRSLVDQVRIPPQSGKYKVYIIDEVHMLSQAAFNAFLKTLEEPPSYAKFILATTEKHKIIPTILSRCQIYDFKRIMASDIVAHLRWVGAQEKVTVDEEALHVIARKADGALRDALSIFDQIVSFAGKEITYEAVIKNLNVLDYEYYFNVLDLMKENNIAGLLLLFNNVMTQGFDGHHFITGLAEHIRSILVCKDPATTKLLETSDAVKERYQKQAGDFSIYQLIHSLDITSKADHTYRAASNKRLHIEIMLMQLAQGVNGSNTEKKKPEAVTAPAAEQPKTAKTPEINKQSIKSTPTDPPPVTPPESSGKEKEGVPLKTSDTTKNTPRIVVKTSDIDALSLKSLDSEYKKINGKQEVAEQSFDEITEEEITPLDQEQTTVAIIEYANHIASEHPSFSTSLAASEPLVQKKNRIKLRFENTIVADQKHLNNLMDFLKEKFNNQHIWYDIEISHSE
ncbi:MAG: DNA polymerase III subunit gamma/tau, partial [Bacteroidales bacterium]|nr:DNA polymerase III subunit gamma/tau [Bacteroidales bacterium]